MKKNVVNNLTSKTLSEGRNFLYEFEANEVLSYYNLPIPKHFLARNVQEATLEKLREALPDYCILGNPLDLTGNALSNMWRYNRKVLRLRSVR